MVYESSILQSRNAALARFFLGLNGACWAKSTILEDIPRLVKKIVEIAVRAGKRNTASFPPNIHRSLRLHCVPIGL